MELLLRLATPLAHAIRGGIIIWRDHGSGGICDEGKECVGHFQARQDVARRVDSTLVTLYWNIGQRIRQDILRKKRAQYGKEIVSAVERQLSADFGQGFSEKFLEMFGKLWTDRGRDRYPEITYHRAPGLG